MDKRLVNIVQLAIKFGRGSEHSRTILDWLHFEPEKYAKIVSKPQCRVHKMTMLHYACMANDIEAIDTLLKYQPWLLHVSYGCIDEIAFVHCLYNNCLLAAQHLYYKHMQTQFGYVTPVLKAALYSKNPYVLEWILQCCSEQNISLHIGKKQLLDLLCNVFINHPHEWSKQIGQILLQYEPFVFRDPLVIASILMFVPLNVNVQRISIDSEYFHLLYCFYKPQDVELVCCTLLEKYRSICVFHKISVYKWAWRVCQLLSPPLLRALFACPDFVMDQETQRNILWKICFGNTGTMFHVELLSIVLLENNISPYQLDYKNNRLYECMWTKCFWNIERQLICTTIVDVEENYLRMCEIVYQAMCHWHPKRFALFPLFVQKQIVAFATINRRSWYGQTHLPFLPKDITNMLYGYMVKNNVDDKRYIQRTLALLPQNRLETITPNVVFPFRRVRKRHRQDAFEQLQQQQIQTMQLKRCKANACAPVIGKLICTEQDTNRTIEMDIPSPSVQDYIVVGRRVSKQHIVGYHVDMDLKKMQMSGRVSRVHFLLAYDPVNEKWKLMCKGRNGMEIDNTTISREDQWHTLNRLAFTISYARLHFSIQV